MEYHYQKNVGVLRMTPCTYVCLTDKFAISFVVDKLLSKHTRLEVYLQSGTAANTSFGILHLDLCNDIATLVPIPLIFYLYRATIRISHFLL